MSTGVILRHQPVLAGDCDVIALSIVTDQLNSHAVTDVFRTVVPFASFGGVLDLLFEFLACRAHLLQALVGDLDGQKTPWFLML